MTVLADAPVRALFRVHRVAEDPPSPQAFLQGRLAAFSEFLCLVLLGTWVVNAALNAIFYPSFAEGRLLSHRSLVHATVSIGWGALWLALRRGRWPLRALSAADLLGTLSLAVALGFMIVLGEARYRPELVMSMALVQMLVFRAAIVPSTVTRTFIIGALTEVPILVGAHILASRPDRPNGLPAPSSVVASLVVWAMMSLATTTVISSVIYGLRQRVRDAIRLGQYTLESKLGEGGMGAVYRARHAFLRRPTAVKVLSVGRADDTMLAQFEREVQSTARLSHPNIVSVYDFGRSASGVLYYVMEYLDGIDLERLVRADGPQHEGRVKRILIEAADALAEAHAAGLIHHDIKPSNIILCARGRHNDQVKLVDFGLVKEASALAGGTAGQSIHGTPLYMAPELIQKPDAVDARADLYALGGVGYFLLAGVPVFEGASAVELCARHVSEAPVPPSIRAGRSIDGELEQIVLRCLAKAPEHRPSDAATLLDELRACDGCASWAAEEAKRWWTERAPDIRAKGPKPVGPTSPLERRLEVDLRGRD